MSKTREPMKRWDLLRKVRNVFHKMKSTCLELLFSLFSLAARCQCQIINGHLRVASYYLQYSSGNLSSPSANKLSLIEVKLLDMLAVSLNFTYEIHNPTDVLELGSPTKKNDETSWTGVLGQVVRHEVDLTTSFGPHLYSRSRNVDVTVPVIVDNIVIVVPYPRQHSDILAMFGMFSPWLWTAYIGVNFFVGYAIYFVAFLKRGKNDYVLAYQSVLVNGVGITLGQGGYLRHHSLASRMIEGSWLFTVLVFTNAFTGSLISMITNPKFQFVIQSIEDVAINEDMQPLIINESSTHSEFKESTNPIFQKIFKRIEANPDKLLVPSSSNFVELLLSDPRQVLIMSDLLADSEIEKDLRKTGKCRVTVLPNKVKSRKNSIFLQKNSPFTKTINKQLLLLTQKGFPGRSHTVDHTFASRCYIDERKMKNDKRNRRVSPLTMYDLRGLSFNIGMLLISFVVLLCEILFAKYQRRHRTTGLPL
ncbi:hypothetical protein GHT06_011125 [Daphnia sinensis]|uniref:Ionotropic glutamate receptor C-terminal domain-containing protein n=1 Tax=Daphnia sinensis TaxID=1820382 RepID=A0AAD5KZK1_9CRUS|nr:hypothetical protein GHT06_011125 [Daphnia sinensis]